MPQVTDPETAAATRATDLMVEDPVAMLPVAVLALGPVVAQEAMALVAELAVMVMAEADVA
ncbi:MAG TPA: hypothetical protein VM639_00740 [Dongiaceae bacterium]|nr:hypothetical protein [Dongiaceae bacterium]